MPVVPMREIASLCISNVPHILPGIAPGFHLHGALSAAHPCAALTWAVLDLTRQRGYKEGLCCFLSGWVLHSQLSCFPLALSSCDTLS